MHSTKPKWITALALVLAVGGLWLASCSDLPGTSTTEVIQSTTTGAVETSVSETVTTTATTIAPTTTSTAAPATTTTHSTAAPITTTTLSPEAVHLAYIQSVHHLLNEIDLDETRIPELVAQINSTMPYVPHAVLDELQGMAEFITMYLPEAAATPPAGYEAAQTWLGQSANQMLLWINNLMIAIATMSGSGQVSEGAPHLAAAAGAQAAYTVAKANHYAAIPDY